MWSVSIVGSPTTKGSMRCIGQAGKHQLIADNRPALKTWTKQLHAGVDHLLGRGMPILAGPVGVDVTFTLARPKTVSVTERPWPTGRGLDVDKAARAVLDALQPKLFADDAQVVELTARKAYPDTPGCVDVLDRPGAVIRIWQTAPREVEDVDLVGALIEAGERRG